MRPRCVQTSTFLPREAGGDIKDDTALLISTTAIELQLRQSKKLLMPPGQSPGLFTGVFVREQVIIATASLGLCVRLGRSHKKTLLAVLGLSGSHTCRAVLLSLFSDQRQMAPGMTGHLLAPSGPCLCIRVLPQPHQSATASLWPVTPVLSGTF